MKNRKSKATGTFSVVVVLFLLLTIIWRKIFPKRDNADDTSMTDDFKNTITIINPFMSAKKTAEAIIKKFEGLRLRAYLDSAGIPTIGYGTIVYSDGTRVKITDVITKEKAEQEFEHHFNKFYNEVEQKLKVSVKDHQKAALVSFAYNVGISALTRSTLWRKLHEQRPEKEIADEFRKWVYAGGVVVQGLVNRRESERNLYLS
ncbi:lysozyme [Sediminibacterium sp.]|uniref:lysozyme n=1 Tax=Sediminibacterium sp. TaxID=1917865 RepID=UPI003F72F579